jgi:starch synthase
MKNVWILSFECAGVVKVGGLGEAVYNIAKHLADRGFNVTLFMPSHGVHKVTSLVEKLKLQKNNVTIEGKIIEKNFMPYRNAFKYKIGILNGQLSGFDLVIFHGLDKDSKAILDDATVYRTERIEDKAMLLARGIAGYVEQLKLNQNMPDVIHAHDYHATPAAVLARQKLETYNHKAGLILTIHLLSGKKVSWNYLGENWCGITNKPHPIILNNQRIILTHRQVLKKAKFKLESFGAIEADVLASVSRSYLQDEVTKRLCPDCEGKTAFHWNGCDWDFKAMLKDALAKFGDDIKSTLRVKEIQRHDLREYFLTKALGNLRPEEPIIDEGEAKELITCQKDKPFLGEGKVEPFSTDGPMVLMTGRLTEQKGVDTLFAALPRVLEKVPNAKFVLLMLPLEEELSLVRKSVRLSRKYKESFRIVLGKAPSIYTLAHLASDIFVCPSKWEPFGIMALEAMAAGNPVVATEVGGLKEITIDVKHDLENATGMLVPKNDSKSLADATSSLLKTMLITETQQKERRTEQNAAEEIENSILKEAAIRNPFYGQKLRENAIRRVESTFRWSKVIDMLIEIYEKAIETAKRL